eukprot:CAMPEP_0181410374 /NCGR_PEP_ID=MMETSP1110-20121109/7304_1 /TAXON_ID=174948 /ORGANISM="Symbiodinium sp., Strain CCMP421" /LENGTH=68 /DNA_ID=CAMNT_0023532915 /DNA_START=448 /DNA_END=654 /DNA_ORIENTATION=+
MTVVVLIGLEVVLKARMAASRRNGQVEEAPVEQEGAEPRQVERGEEGVGVVVQMLNGMHGEPREWLGV